MEIVFVIIGYIAEKKEAVEFLEKLKEKVKICDEAVWFCRVSICFMHEDLNEICSTEDIFCEWKRITESKFLWSKKLFW